MSGPAAVDDLLMAGAVLTNIFVLQTSPVLPLILGVLAAVVTVVPSRKEN